MYNKVVFSILGIWKLYKLRFSRHIAFTSASKTTCPYFSSTSRALFLRLLDSLPRKILRTSWREILTQDKATERKCTRCGTASDDNAVLRRKIRHEARFVLIPICHRLGKESEKQTGRGYIANDVLVLFVKGEDGETYRKFIDDYAKYLFPIVGKQGEYKGYYTEYSESDSFDIFENTYFVWFKKI